MARGRKRKKAPSPEVVAIRPTPEREARNQTISAGMARRIKPMIDILRDKGFLSAEQHEKLSYYRDQANLAEISPVRSCCDNEIRGGSGNGVSAAITSARLEVARMHRDLMDYGANGHDMIGVLEAVARDDKSITAYCVEKYGGRERYGKGGKFIAFVPVKEKVHVRLEKMNLLYAAGVITT